MTVMVQGDKRVHTFPKGISPKGNIIARLEFELAYYDVTVKHLSHCVSRRLFEY